MSRRIAAAGFVAFVVAALACEVATESSGGVGVDAPVLSFADTTTLGGAGAEGAEAFGRVWSVALIADETQIAVADGQTQEVHLFSVGGEHLRTVGGDGGGPGEHRAIREVWGGTDGGLCTWDVQIPRVNRFSASGEVIGSSVVDLEGMERIRPSFRGFLDDCTFVLEDGSFIGDLGDTPEGLRRDTARFYLFGADGASIRMLAQPTNAERWFRNRDQSRGFVDLIFGEELFGFPVGQELWFGTSDVLTWTRADLTGRTRGGFELGYTPRLASETEIDAERERRIAEVEAPAGIGPPELAERIVESGRSGIRGVPARDRFPAYDDVARGPGPTFWIREYPGPSDTEASWLLIDSADGLLGQLILPRDHRIVAGSARSVVVLTRDPFDAPVIHVLR